MIIIVILLAGLVVGSFLNVVIARLPELKDILTGRSQCPKCRQPLKWYELIPIFSYVLLAGRCRYCREKISWQYPAVEITTALLFVASYLKFGLSISFWFYLAFLAILIIIFVYDLKTMYIPDLLVWLGIILTIVFLLLSRQQLVSSIYGALAIGGLLGLLVLISRGKWMGAGDVKLGILIGLLSPWPIALVTLFSAFLIGGITGGILIIFKQKTLKQTVPFSPFLITGWLIAFFWGQKIIEFYLGR